MGMDIDLIAQNLANNQLDRIKDKKASLAKEQELREVCEGFEAIFLKTMVSAMRQTLPGNAIFDESNSMNIYESMQDQYLAEHLSKGKKSIGIKDFLYDQLKYSL